MLTTVIGGGSGVLTAMHGNSGKSSGVLPGFDSESAIGSSLSDKGGGMERTISGQTASMPPLLALASKLMERKEVLKGM